jgi:predicted GNAT family acetyltransferase
MIFHAYPDASAFLARTQKALEADEAANGLMLGICLRLEQFPERIKTPPYFATVEDERGLAFAALMTPPHNLVAYGCRGDLDRPAELVVQNLLARGWSVPGVLGPLDAARAFAVAWARVSGGRAEEGMSQRVYALREVIPPRPVPGQLRAATREDVALVAQWTVGFHVDIFGTPQELAEAEESAERKILDGDLYLWEDQRPVSMAGRTRPTAHGISVGPVYTPPEFRKRGYATACVAALSQELLAAGYEFCALFTDLSNPTSNHIYTSIGYRPVCDYQEYVLHTKDKEPS